jgi:hypothetical protein
MTGRANLTAEEREANGVLCDCGHRVMWHHDERGCGFHGYSNARCECYRDSDAAVERIVAARVDAALAEVEQALRGFATERFDARGPHDQRGAALWDAAAYIAEDVRAGVTS